MEAGHCRFFQLFFGPVPCWSRDPMGLAAFRQRDCVGQVYPEYVILYSRQPRAGRGPWIGRSAESARIGVWLDRSATWGSWGKIFKIASALLSDGVELV